MLLAGCDAGTGPEFDSGAEPLQLNRTSVELQSGDTTRLTATVAGESNKASAPRIAWTSSDPSVVEISRSGLILAKQSGEALITASFGRLRVDSRVKVTGSRKSIIIAPKVDTLGIGASLQLNATVLDSKGKVDAEAPVEWVSLSTDVANVNTLGKVTTIAGGVALITATSRGIIDTARVYVVAHAPSASSIASVTLTPSSASLQIGQETPLVAQAADANGNPVPEAAFTWSSSAPGVATVSETGVVRAAATGSAVITATAAGISARAGITVAQAPVAPPPPGSSVAELPRVRVETRYVAPAGKTIFVPAGGDLQKALNDAQRGDVITLAAGATYTGSFILPQKAGSGWITIRPEASVSLPTEGTRMSPAQASKLPKLITPGTEAALRTAPRASQYRIVGVEIAAAPSVTLNYGLVEFGDGSDAQNSLDLVPSQLILDRVYVHGHAKLDLKRCVAFNSAHSAVIDSYLSECHYKGADAQAIGGWNGPGPFKITNNYLEGSGENVMFGGAETSIRGLVPSDIEVVGNHIFKPLSWKGLWSVKNLLELKNAQRVRIEGNVLENSWKDGQEGYAVLLTPRTEYGRNYWSVVRDITVRNNWIKDAVHGFQVHANPDAPEYRQDEHQRRVVIENNLITGLSGQAFLLVSDLEDFIIQHNTVTSGGTLHSALYLESNGAPIRRLVYRDNVIGSTAYGLFSSQGEGTRGLAANTTGGYSVQGNVFVGRSASEYPAGNYFPGSNAEVGFVSPAAGDYRISATSVLAKSIAGPMPGVDMDALKQATSGVVR